MLVAVGGGQARELLLVDHLLLLLLLLLLRIVPLLEHWNKTHGATNRGWVNDETNFRTLLRSDQKHDKYRASVYQHRNAAMVIRMDPLVSVPMPRGQRTVRPVVVLF